MSLPILATKLYAPPLQAKVVRRPRLLEYLKEALSRKLTLVSAPAGFGKTTVVCEWIADCDRPVAWLSLDEDDNETHRFLRYLASALLTLNTEIGQGVLAALQSSQPPPVESILTTLLNDISSNPEPFLLVLDDYHLIDAKPIDDALAFLLKHLPPHMHLVITTREDPQLPLARLRARGQLTELRATHLRFTPTEAATFLNQMMGLSLSPEDVTALDSRTEGWIAGLQLAALSMQGHQDASRFIQSFTGSHHYVMDYLVEEVLQQQPSGIQSFLLQTSILDRLCGPLCDAIVLDSSTKGQDTLEYLEQSNLFVIPLDNERRWFRYHHLFGDLLKQRLEQQNLPPSNDQIASASALHLRASVWLEENNLIQEAIVHALAAKELERTASLLELVWPAMDGSFQSERWLTWAKKIPHDIVRLRPVLSVAYAWALLNIGELETAEARLQDAERWLNQEDATQAPDSSEPMTVVDDEQFHSLAASIATARSYSAQALGDISGSIKYSQLALDLLPEQDYLKRGQAAALIGLAQWAQGHLEDAHESLAETMTYFQMAGHTVFAISVTYGLADLRIAQGRLHDATRTYERSLDIIKEHNGPTLQGSAELYLGLSDLSLEQGDLDTAKKLFEQSEELGEQAGLPNWPYRRCFTLARIKETEGDLDAAFALLEKAEQLYVRSPMPDFRPVAALKATLSITQNKLHEAQVWVRERSLSANDELSYLQEFEHLTLCRTLIAEYKTSPTKSLMHDAMNLLERLYKAADESYRTGSLIDILIQQALAFEAQDDVGSACVPLERALSFAEPEGYIRTFVNEGPPMARLLSHIATQGVMPDYANKLLVRFEGKENKIATHSPQASSQPPLFSVQPLVEPLSQRELEVLQLIAQGLSNRDISETLHIALTTVKGHNLRIFGKLNVRRRTEAVARAREVGLL